MTKVREVTQHTRTNLLKYLDGGEGIWIDGDGEKKYIYQLDLEHLNNCMHRIKSDIENYNFSAKDLELAEQKINQLQEELRNRIS